MRACCWPFVSDYCYSSQDLGFCVDLDDDNHKYGTFSCLYTSCFLIESLDMLYINVFNTKEGRLVLEKTIECRSSRKNEYKVNRVRNS